MTEDGHDAILEALAATLSRQGGPVARFETHGARILVGKHTTLKVKREVRYAYMDFSTLQKRKDALARELEINQRSAPGLYLRLAPVTRDCDGTFSLDGSGEVVEWALEMRSFRQEDLLSAIAARGPLGAGLAKATADAILAMHAAAPAVPTARDTLPGVVGELTEAFAAAPTTFPAREREAWAASARAALDATAAVRAARLAAGHVRRCHGDLHLRNIVLWQGRPAPFDALEFDEALATIDVLYDLAFLLMDLDQRDRREDANIVLNRYLWRSGRTDDLQALAALPLMLSLRAGIRAMVAAQKAALDTAGTVAGEARDYFAAACTYLAPARPVLVAVGGLSGTGKTTLAAAIAPWIGHAPGAVHLRSDLERKSLAGVGELERLPEDAYTARAAQAVYARLYERAELVLKAGHSVVVDAVFARPEERAAIAAIAGRLASRQELIWLSAPPDVLKRRVASRSDDASDATPDVVEKQLRHDPGTIDWTVVAAGATAEETRGEVARRLGLRARSEPSARNSRR